MSSKHDKITLNITSLESQTYLALRSHTARQALESETPTMGFKLPLEDLLCEDYNPADDSPLKFRDIYGQLVERRDALREELNALREQFNAKEQRREEFTHAGGTISERTVLVERFELTACSICHSFRAERESLQRPCW